jgi:HK97 family phage portal protein
MQDKAKLQKRAPSFFERIVYSYLTFKASKQPGQSGPIPFPGLGGGWAGGGLWDYSAGGYPLGSMSLGWQGGFADGGLDYRALAGDLIQSSLVMSAVNWLGLTLGEAPLQLKKKEKEEGKEEKVHDHPLLALFQKPNDIYSDRDLMMAFAINWLIDGNVFWYKVRSARGIPVEIWPLPYFSVFPRWPANGLEFISHYDYQVNGRYWRIETEDMVHFRYGYDPRNLRRGLSPLGSILREIFSDNQTSNWAAALMRNHGVPPLLITPEGENNTINATDIQIIKEDMQEKTTGEDRGKVVVLSGPVKAQLLGFKPDDLDLGAIRNVPEERLCAVTRIPRLVLGFGATDAQPTYANYQTAVRVAYTGCVIPTQKIIQRKLDTSFLMPQKWSNGQTRADFEKSEDLNTSFDLSHVSELQDDQDRLFNRTGLLYSRGGMKRKTLLAMTGQPFDDKLDDVYYDPKAGVTSADAPPQLAVDPAETDINIAKWRALIASMDSAIAKEKDATKKDQLESTRDSFKMLMELDEPFPIKIDPQAASGLTREDVVKAVRWWEATQEPTGAGLITAKKPNGGA